MTFPSLAVLFLVAALVGSGTYLTLERTLSRIFIGLALIGNGVNVLLLAMGGASGLPPLLGGDSETIVDPLPQAMILTSIVLSLGTTAFGLALAYRSWLLKGNDEVVDDVEDRRLARRHGKTWVALDESFAEGTEDASLAYDLDDEADRPHSGRSQ